MWPDRNDQFDFPVDNHTAVPGRPDVWPYCFPVALLRARIDDFQFVTLLYERNVLAIVRRIGYGIAFDEPANRLIRDDVKNVQVHFGGHRRDEMENCPETRSKVDFMMNSDLFSKFHDTERKENRFNVYALCVYVLLYQYVKSPFPLKFKRTFVHTLSVSRLTENMWNNRIYIVGV